MKQTFKFRMNTATIIFLIAYTVYVLYMLITMQWDVLPILIGFGILVYAFFLGCRPYAYDIEKKTITIKYYLWKNKEIDLMRCETMCDPVSRWADIATRPHAIEIYTDTKKRYCFFPKDRLGFIHAVVKANKRIHCTVQEYTDARRDIERRERKERKKAEMEAKKGAK